MGSTWFPAEQDIRDALIRRTEEFCRKTGISKTEIGKRAVNDGAFISQVAEGRNFTVRLYQRVMDWLDSNWPEPERDAPNVTKSISKHDRSRRRPQTGHFSRFKHLRSDHFRTAAEIEEHINQLREEWSRR